MSAEEYLKSLGIDPEKYVLVAYIDGVMRTPDLIAIMEGFKKAI